MPEGLTFLRSRFTRQAASLWQMIAAIQRQLTRVSWQPDDTVQVIKTFLVAACGYIRSALDRHFRFFTEYEYYPVML